MSVIVTAHYNNNETFEVEIFHDGSIDFPDRDLQYEQAMAEFYPPGSGVVDFYKCWHEDSDALMYAVVSHFEISKECLILLMADCVEHVLDLYEREHDGDPLVRNVIDDSRKFVAGTVDIKTVERSRVLAGRFVAKSEEDDSTSNFTADEAAAASAEWLGWMVESSVSASDVSVRDWLRRGDMERKADWCAAMARKAASVAGLWWDIEEEWDNDAVSDEHNLLYKEEALWQIRRFVDCMEAVGQGKDWPDLGATK